jgi:hypothetical protein
MVDGVLAVEDDGRIIADMDTGFAEFGDGDADDFKKFVESDIYIVLIDQISVGRFLQIGGCRLRNQDFFYLHAQL